LLKISKHLEVLTNAEGLTNHFEAVRGRLNWKKIGLKKKLKNLVW
jgi:histidinol dehydrogenase